MKIENFKIWVVGAGLFNIVAAFPLAMPFTLKYFNSFWNQLNHLLGLGGQDLILPENGNNLLWVNTCGLALFLVGLLLLYASKDLKNRMGIPFLNGIIRVLFCILAVYYVIVADISRIILGIAMVDLIIGCIFIYFYSFLINKQKE